MEDILIHGDEYILRGSRLKGEYSHVISINCEDGTGTATMTTDEALKLAFYLLQDLKVEISEDA